jgi:hypothetical protein
MFRKVVIALARHGVNLSGCPARTRTPRPRPTAVRRETNSIRICECDMGRYGGGKCVIPDDDNNPNGKYAGEPCLSVWTTDDAGCEEDQYGCPSTACDGDDKPWCMTEYTWCYCE